MSTFSSRAITARATDSTPNGPKACASSVITFAAETPDSQRVAERQASHTADEEMTQKGKQKNFAMPYVTSLSFADEARGEDDVASESREQAEAIACEIAHDFNNLLTVVTIAARLVAKAAPADRDYHLRAIDDAAGRAAKLSNQLKTLYCHQPPQTEPVDVAAMVKTMLPCLRFAMGPGIELSVDLGEQLCTAHVVPYQLETAIMNLAINARDAMPDGGRLQIALTIKPGGMTLSMKDNGRGMVPGEFERVFEPFFTTKGEAGGSGLGLSQVARFVRSAKGGITMRTEPRVGTEFVIDLPAAMARNCAEPI